MLKFIAGLIGWGMFFLWSCKSQEPAPHTVNRAFYYWKSIFAPTAYEKRLADTLQVNTIYIKLFDVTWNQVSGVPEPVAKLQVKDTVWLQKKRVIPTVFIANESLYKLDSVAVGQLAANLLHLSGKLIEQNKLPDCKELQIDCDWSAATRDRYFQLLKTIKKSGRYKDISATIRLHQVKYKQAAGIPPVDKGLLMCYNMGDLQLPVTRNSIIDEVVLERYIQNLPRYPLPLDAALPLFSWMVIFNGDRYAGLIRDVPESLDRLTAIQKNSNGYIVVKDTSINGRALTQGQYLRLETSAFPVVERAGKALAKRMNTGAFDLALYHMDSVTLKKYSQHELESIYNSLH